MTEKEKELEVRARELDKENRRLTGDLEVANIDISGLRKQVLRYHYITGEKSLFLFGAAFILYSLNIVPVIFLTAMGIMQLITAVSGGIAAYGFQYAKRRLAA